MEEARSTSVYEEAEEGEKLQIIREEKVVVNLKAVGNAPQLKKDRCKFKVPGNNKFTVVANYVKKLIQQESVFLYIQSFSPSPDSSMADLYNCFGVGGEVVVNYAVVEAWG